MFKDEILENERRRKIYSFIKANPGIHLRELQRVLSMPLASLEYHLKYMARKKIIFGEKNRHYTRYYCKPLEPEDKRVLLALRQKRMREIVLIILVNKKAKYQFLAESLKLPHSTISLYLKYLVDHGIIERTKIGYENLYTVKDEDRVAKILIAYKSGFLDKLIDKALSTWMENSYSKEKPE
jgi:predicted transcriptional regulator